MERCTICDKDLSTLPEEGCEHCGLEYDPLAPDEAKPLDFNKDLQTVYIPDSEGESLFNYDLDDE